MRRAPLRHAAACVRVTRSLQAESFMARQADVVVIAISLLSNDVPEFSAEMNAVVSSPATQTRIVVDQPSQLTQNAKNRTIDLLCNNANDCLPTTLCAAG